MAGWGYWSYRMQDITKKSPQPQILELLQAGKYYHTMLCWG